MTGHGHPSPPARHDQPAPQQLAGLDRVRALADGRTPAPSMAQTLPATVLAPAPGHVELRATPDGRFLNPMGTVHGGWMLTMLDTAMALAAQTTLQAGEDGPTHETSAKFVRPILPDGKPFRIFGTVVSRGRGLITVDGRIEDETGKLYAHGTSTCVVVRREVAGG